MIVDGLGHVSLDSGPNMQQQQPQQQQAANIHQGSIPATGRKDGLNSSSSMKPPMSAANSVQFNQLIGGAVSPSIGVLQQQQQQQLAVAAATAQGLNLVQQQQQQPAASNGGAVNLSPNLMIGDYAQSGMATGFRQ